MYNFSVKRTLASGCTLDGPWLAGMLKLSSTGSDGEYKKATGESPQRYSNVFRMSSRGVMPLMIMPTYNIFSDQNKWFLIKEHNINIANKWDRHQLTRQPYKGIDTVA